MIEVEIAKLNQKIKELEQRIVQLESKSHEPVDITELIRSTLVSYDLIERCAEDE